MTYFIYVFFLILKVFPFYSILIPHRWTRNINKWNLYLFCRIWVEKKEMLWHFIPAWIFILNSHFMFSVVNWIYWCVLIWKSIQWLCLFYTWLTSVVVLQFYRFSICVFFQTMISIPATKSFFSIQLNLNLESEKFILQ